MKKLLAAALSDQPWAFSGLVFGLEDVLDDEGRPLHERRAPSGAKTGVPMELRACPYEDERHGLPMNVSALDQLTRYFPQQAANVSKFRAMIGDEQRPWEIMLLSLLDLLSAPSIELLRTRNPDRPVPVMEAAGYKIAAGYFDALRRILVQEIRGHKVEFSSAGFLDYIREHKVLIGQSEACAGPPHLIAGFSRLLLGPIPIATEPEAPDVRRIAIVRALAAQVRLGLCWKVLDETAEKRLLAQPPAAQALPPRNQIVARRLADRIAAAEAAESTGFEPICAALPDVPGAEWCAPLRRSIEAWANDEAGDEKMVGRIQDVLAHGDGGFGALDEDVRASYAHNLASIMALYRQILGVQWHLERTLREHLGFPVDTPMTFSGEVLPMSRCISWLEIITGHGLLCVPGPAPEMALHNHRRTAQIIASGESQYQPLFQTKA